MVRQGTYETAERMLDRMCGKVKTEPNLSEEIQPRSIEQIERECNEAWYCNAIRGARQMRGVAYAKVTGQWDGLPCYWCRFLGIGDFQPQAHTNEVVAGARYHEYLQDYGQK